MKIIEDIKEFKDIDTYYEISKIVDEVFQDRVEVHKHLVTANKEIKRLKEEYMILQNASDEVEEELQQRIDKAIEYMERYMFSQKENYDYIHLLDILKGVDKE